MFSTGGFQGDKTNAGQEIRTQVERGGRRSVRRAHDTPDQHADVHVFWRQPRRLCLENLIDI